MNYKKLLLLITIILVVPLYHHGIGNPGMWENIRMWLPSQQRMTVGAKILLILGATAVVLNFKSVFNKGYSYLVKSGLREYFRRSAEQQEEDIIHWTIWDIRVEITRAKESINHLSPCKAQSHDQIKEIIDTLNIDINKKIDTLSKLCEQLQKQNKCSRHQKEDILRLRKAFDFFVMVVRVILDWTQLFATSEHLGKKFAESLQQNVLDAALLTLIKELRNLMPLGSTLSATLAKDAAIKLLLQNIHLVNNTINTAPQFIQEQCATIWKIYIENAREVDQLIAKQLQILNNYTKVLENLNKLKFVLTRKKEQLMIEGVQKGPLIEVVH